MRISCVKVWVCVSGELRRISRISMQRQGHTRVFLLGGIDRVYEWIIACTQGQPQRQGGANGDFHQQVNQEFQDCKSGLRYLHLVSLI
jgi:hypothetical protein